MSLAARGLILALCASLGSALSASPNAQQTPTVSPLVRGALFQVPVQLLAFPIDTFKTRLQIPFGAPGPYQGSDRAFAVRRVNALQPPYWSGIGASLINQLPTFMIMYNVFEFAREKLENRFPAASKISIDVAASMAGSVVGNLWSTPCEVIKCTFQSGMYTASVKSAIRAIHKESGFRGFYQGCTAQILRDLPLFTLMFGSYEVLHDYYSSNFLVEKDKRGKVTKIREASDLVNACLGAASGAVAATLTNPLDVVRTQATMRTWGGETASSSLLLIPRIFAEQGVRGLMAGMGARSVYMGLGAAAFFVAYENSMKRLAH
eukprot:Tamp_24090.p1 GENE.Tamp_24090~~Tamp_24090.p1  ORF type:complete len:320 (+),score=30.08 Tamp_24090:1-960(+)